MEEIGILLLIVLLIGAVACYLDYKYNLVFCCRCKTKMKRKFIPEEDCEEYTCPKCGHKFKVFEVLE